MGGLDQLRISVEGTWSPAGKKPGPSLGSPSILLQTTSFEVKSCLLAMPLLPTLMAAIFIPHQNFYFPMGF